MIRTLSLAAEAFCSFLNTEEASASVLKVPLRSVHRPVQFPNPEAELAPPVHSSPYTFNPAHGEARESLLQR